MSYIPESIIQEIRSRADILEVVGEHLSLKKKGKDYWACCPFHDEKTPSFSVAPNKNIYKCFGCGASGDAVKFVMDIEHINYPEALRKLAQKYHIEIPEIELNQEQQEAFDEKQRLYGILKFAQEHYQKNLYETQDGKAIAQSYFRHRGISPQSMKEFGLGYALHEWENLKSTITKQQYELDLADKAGLFSQKDDRKYDRFRNRVMFPIWDVAGRVVGFGARTMGEDMPKYLNSPETEIYHKSEILYGLFQAKSDIRKQENCFLTEGYLDVISMYQIGFKNTVASSGTSLTKEQVKLIKRFSENITIVYDSDTAGQKAALRAIDLILSEGLNVSIVKLPKGEDPDSFTQKNNFEFVKQYFSENTQDFLDYKKNILLAENYNSPILRNNAIKEILQSIALVPDPIVQHLYLEKLGQLFEIENNLLKNELSKIIKKDVSKPNLSEKKVFEAENDNKTVKIENNVLSRNIVELEKESIRLLLMYGHQNVLPELKTYQYLFEELADVDYHTPLYIEILEFYKQKLSEGFVVDIDFVKEFGNPPMQELVKDFETKIPKTSPNWTKWNVTVMNESDNLAENLFKTCLRFKSLILQEYIKNTLQKLDEACQENDENQINRLLITQMNLQEQLKQVTALLGNVMNSPLFLS